MCSSDLVTDSTPLEDPKDPDTCNCFKIYSLLASEEQILTMRKNYEGGNYGYGHAKQALFELICERFSNERAKFNEYMENKALLDEELSTGAKKAKAIITNVLKKVKAKVGY